MTEDRLLSSAVLYTQGYLPPLAGPSLSRSHIANSLLNRLTRWPRKVYDNIIHQIGVNWAGQLANTVANRPFSVAWLAMLVALTWAVVGHNRWPTLGPAVIWALALCGMAVATAAVLAAERRGRWFRAWSTLLATHCPNLDVSAAERRFRRLSWRPYLGLWAAVAAHLAVAPLAPPALVVWAAPAAGLCALAALSTLSERLGAWRVAAVATHIIAAVPAAHLSLREWLIQCSGGPNGSFLSDLLLEEGQFPLIGALHLHYGLAPLSHLLWIILMLIGSVTRGISAVLHHLVTALWCQVTVEATRAVISPTQLVLPALAWSSLALIPAAPSALAVIGPGVLVSALCVLQVENTTWASAFVLFGAIFSLYTLRRLWPGIIEIFRIVLVIVCVICLVQPALHAQNYNHHKPPSSLKWEAFHNVCVPSSSSNQGTKASNIEGCHSFLGTQVRWSGQVTEVDIELITNWPEKIISSLPTVLESNLRCIIGNPISSCYKGKLNEKEFQRCILLRNVHGPDYCSMEMWNSYTFDLELSMSSTFWKFGKEVPRLHLVASHEFKDFALGLEIGDKVEFTGALAGDVGSAEPKISLSSIVCIQCGKKLTPKELRPHSLLIDVQRPARHMFNFFFNPLLSV